MGWLTGTKKDAEPTESEKLSKEIAALRDVVSKARRETDIEVELESKKKELLDKELELKKVEEDHATRMREIEHKVGLQQKAAEQDQKAAISEAKLAVREENLEGSKQRFEEQMTFQREEMDKRADSQERLLGQILERLPKHNVHQFVGDPPSGDAAKAAAQLGSGD